MKLIVYKKIKKEKNLSKIFVRIRYAKVCAFQILFLFFCKSNITNIRNIKESVKKIPSISI